MRKPEHPLTRAAHNSYSRGLIQQTSDSTAQNIHEFRRVRTMSAANIVKHGRRLPHGFRSMSDRRGFPTMSVRIRTVPPASASRRESPPGRPLTFRKKIRIF